MRSSSQLLVALPILSLVHGFKTGKQFARGTLTDVINLVGAYQFLGFDGFKTGGKRQFLLTDYTDGLAHSRIQGRGRNTILLADYGDLMDSRQGTKGNFAHGFARMGLPIHGFKAVGLLGVKRK